MRLSQKERQSIVDGIREAFEGSDVKWSVYLFGSRTRPNTFGGDFDLLLVTQSGHGEYSRDRKHILLSRIKKYLGDQRVDLLIRDENEFNSDQDPFLESIRNDLELIFRFK